MIVKGRELVRFVSTLSQFLLFSSSFLPYSFYPFFFFLSSFLFLPFFPVYYTCIYIYIYSQSQKFSRQIVKMPFSIKKKKKQVCPRFEI